MTVIPLNIYCSWSSTFICTRLKSCVWFLIFLFLVPNMFRGFIILIFIFYNFGQIATHPITPVIGVADIGKYYTYKFPPWSEITAMTVVCIKFDFWSFIATPNDMLIYPSSAKILQSTIPNMCLISQLFEWRWFREKHLTLVFMMNPDRGV